MKNKVIWLSLIGFGLGFGEFPIATGPYRDEDPKVACLGNDLIVAYHIYSGEGWNPVKVVRVNGLTGEKIWEKAVSDDSCQGRHQIAVDNNNRKIWVAFVKCQYPSPDAIFLQRFSPEGEKELGPMGLEVSAGEGDRTNPHLALSPDGGTWITWTDYRSGDADVYLARISPEGKKEWEVAVCSLPGAQVHPVLVPSGEGAFIFWDNMESVGAPIGVYGNRILGDSLQWGPQGKPIITYSSTFDIPPSSFLQEERFFTYATTDFRGGAYVWGIVGVQRIDSLGNLLFDSLPQVIRYYQIISTEDCGTVGCKTGYADYDNPYAGIKAVKIDSLGNLPLGFLTVWKSQIYDTTGTETFSSMASDYHSGFVTTIAGRHSKWDKDIIVVRADSIGNIGVPIIVCDTNADQEHPIIVHNPESNGYFLIWEDSRNDNWDIYGVALDSLLRPGIKEEKTPKPLLISLSITPNPFARLSAISYQLSAPGFVKLNIYNASGQLVRVLVDKREEQGHYRITWDGRDKEWEILPSGIYFCELIAKSKRKIQRKIKKVVLLRR